MITVYSKNNCPKCTLVKNTFKRKGLLFNEINIDDEPQYADDLRDRGFMSAPVVEFGDFSFSGFSLEGIKKVEELYHK